MADTPVKRRQLLQWTIAAGGLAVAGLGSAPTAPAQAAVGTMDPAHTGMLHTQADFDYIAAKIDAGAEPWLSGWNKLMANPRSQAGLYTRDRAAVAADRIQSYNNQTRCVRHKNFNVCWK